MSCQSKNIYHTGFYRNKRYKKIKFSFFSKNNWLRKEANPQRSTVTKQIHPTDVCIHLKFPPQTFLYILAVRTSLENLKWAGGLWRLPEQLDPHLQDWIIITILLKVSPFLHRNRTGSVWVRWGRQHRPSEHDPQYLGWNILRLSQPA